MLSRFHTIPACYGRTDGRTDRIAISISRVSSSMLTRDKNYVTLKGKVTHSVTQCDEGKGGGRSLRNVVHAIWSILSIYRCWPLRPCSIRQFQSSTKCATTDMFCSVKLTVMVIMGANKVNITLHLTWLVVHIGGRG